MPTVNTLTDAKCKSIKAIDKPKKVFDGHGLFLFVSPSGSKIWRMTYRKDGKAQTVVVGPYPLVSLAEARVNRCLTSPKKHFYKSMTYVASVFVVVDLLVISRQKTSFLVLPSMFDA
jgi:hypothetical protein